MLTVIQIPPAVKLPPLPVQNDSVTSGAQQPNSQPGALWQHPVGSGVGVGVGVGSGTHVESQLKADAGEKEIPPNISHATFVISSQVPPNSQQT